MDEKGWADGYEAAATVAAGAHVVSSGWRSINRIRPVIAEDLRHLRRFGRLPRVACPFPEERARPSWLPVVFPVVIGGFAGLVGALARGAVPQAHVPPEMSQQAASMGVEGPLLGLVLGALVGSCWALVARVAGAESATSNDVGRARMNEYWHRRERLRSDLERGRITPAEAAVRIGQFWGIDCE